MNKTTCEVCGSPVLVSDGTTKRYIPDLSDIAKYRNLLRAIIAHAGHPIAAEGCRIIIERCKEALAEDEKHDG